MIDAMSVRPADDENAHAARLAVKVPQADVLALWQEVFDTAHGLGDVPSGNNPPFSARDASANERRHAGSEERNVKRQRIEIRNESRGGGEDRAADGDVSMDVVHSGASMPAAAIFAAERPPIVVAAIGVASGFVSAERSVVAAASVRATEEAPRAPTALLAPAIAAVAPRQKPAVRETVAPPERSLHAAPDELPTAESVRVFQDASGLQIVVRHAGLSAASAIQCAMETARQLTGDRRALQQVVLNGRSVYASIDSSSPQSGPSGRVVFSC